MVETKKELRVKKGISGELTKKPQPLSGLRLIYGAEGGYKKEYYYLKSLGSES